MNNKKNTFFLVIGAITLIAVTLGATYAYFTAQSGGSGNIDTSVITGTTDLISFAFGSEINIQATEENFGQGMGSISDSTTAQVLLRANNTTNNVTTRYNIYLIIEENDFVYSTDEQTPEILLNVTDPNGNKVENITGLVHYEDGFDITTRTGGFLLVPDYEISATDTQTIQNWNVEVTLVNLNSDQNVNTGKTLSGKLYLTQEQMSSYELTEVNSVDATTTYNSITVTPEVTLGSASIDKYYYGIENTTDTVAYNSTNKLTKLSNTLASVEDVNFIESDESSYTFSNLEPSSSYTVYSYTVDENKIKSNVYSTSITTEEYYLPNIDTVSHSVTLNSISLTVNASNGSTDIVKYMYSKDNGASWEESTSNTYTFNDLTDTTEYKIKIKAVDSLGHESTEYYEAITTEIYILPVISSVNSSTTWNSITLTPSGTNGTNTIDHYEYSIDNGAYQTSNVFNNLTDNHEYVVRVKAIDTAGRESNVYEMNVTTDAYTLPTITVTTSSTTNSITVNVNATPGDGSIVSYHYSRDNGSNYTTSSSNSYTFSGLTAGTTYYLKVYVTDSNGRTSSMYVSNITTESNTFANYIVNNVYTGTDGENGLYYHDGQGSYTNADREAGDNSYRYSGANPNNYVCFGSDAASCPSDNLYRIIGVFDNQVKLIKSTSYGNYVWDSSDSNVWSSSDINNTLNSTYLNSLGSTWSSKIETHTWYVGGHTTYNASAKGFYNAESSGTTWNGKVGLMYVSDYGYAANSNAWSNALYYYDEYSSTNWLFWGSIEWTIAPNSSNSNGVFYVYYDGYLYVSNACLGYSARPVFYLNSNVVLTGGTGTASDPYRIT